MANKPDLSDYIEVNDRIAAFYAKHQEGSLQSQWQTVSIGGKDFVVADAFAYRTPDDPRPGQGTAWVPFPGKTNYTRDSELMNAQTSAWGRAIAALGFEVRKGIASREEVQQARDNESALTGRDTATARPTSSVAHGDESRPVSAAVDIDALIASVNPTKRAIVPTWLKGRGVARWEDLDGVACEQFVAWLNK